ncbi:hypothetical protein PA598K_03423 [Paenibacillus sp. 598K]|nr:hypothetical protein PA598K_03423 [Paenibacillus sp. 598K]
MVVDGGGETASTTLARAQGNRIDVLEQIKLPFSLGGYYAAATRYTGMKARHAGKFMGLAAYGRADQEMPLRVSDELRLELDGCLPESGSFADLGAFRDLLESHFERHHFPYRRGDGVDLYPYVGFAASVQHSLEQALLHLVRQLRRLTDATNLVIAGGVGLNCTANGVIADSGIFEHLFIQPASHDAGVAIGAAFEAAKCKGEALVSSRMDDAYLGPSYSDEQIHAAIVQRGLSYTRCSEEELIHQTADFLQQGKLIGWFQGRAEFGPRALGARSIIGNPMDRETLVRLNRLKRREMWRPFAPSVIEEAFDAFFESAHPSPFMIVAAKVLRDKQKEVPAVVHVDGSARPQAVRRSVNPRYWGVIDEFGRRTGIPIVVNTSFNLDHEPIVLRPEEALANYETTELDALVIGSYVLSKQEGFHIPYKESPPAARSTPLDKRLITVHRYIRSHFQQSLSLQQLSDLIACNPIYLSNTYSKVFRVSPMKHIQNLRMEKAKELLVADERNIREIAQSLGYFSASHFSELFKKYYQMTPSQYRISQAMQKLGAADNNESM